MTCSGPIRSSGVRPGYNTKATILSVMVPPPVACLRLSDLAGSFVVLLPCGASPAPPPNALLVMPAVPASQVLHRADCVALHCRDADSSLTGEGTRPR